MSALPKDKRNNLILVGIATLGAMAVLWFFLIESQFTRLKLAAEEIEGSRHRQEKIQKAVENAAQIEADLKTESKVLADYEAQMASGDLYLWQINMIKNFKGNRSVDIPEFARSQPTDCTLLPKFPYRQVSLTVSGSAFYNDFGKFIADFENTYPYMRVVNLQVFPNPTQVPENKEKVGFKMEIVTLTKPGTS
jgi:hypothetical protein